MEIKNINEKLEYTEIHKMIQERKDNENTYSLETVKEKLKERREV